ncbi:hypothetical protein D7X48_11115 [bacterium D16-50]|nr:hypothetical protein D7X48_11115 [bacterium D16-50]
MKKFCEWWRAEAGHAMERRYVTLIKSLLLGILPLVCCLVYCGVQGRSLGEVYPPCSEWNDELFYYKQVEGIVNYGYPQGYFGFNESHALKLSFAAWSPVLVFPWILWGLVFGWNLMSPMFCNIALMTLCCILFVWMVRPTWKQTGILSLLFCLYRPFVRYMLSVMPEIICFSMLIVFYGLAVNYLRREKAYKLVLLFLMSGVMTLMRPYLLLFMLLPAWFWFRRSRWKGAAGSLAVIGAVVGLYACIKHYLGAEYFAPLFFTDWVTAFFEQGLFGGIRYTAGKLYYMGKDFWGHTLQGLRTGLASGAFFAGFLVCTGVLAGQSAADLYKIRRDRKRAAEAAQGERPKNVLVHIEAHLAFSCVAMFFALLLMYKLTEGSKHLLTFMAAAVFVISLMETRFYKKAVLVGVAFAYLYSYMAVNPYDYQVPFVQEERKADVERWQELLGERLSLEEESPGFENVVIWVFKDTVDGISANTVWQLLYALPEGFGVSCCMPEYVAENFDELKSRYLFTAAAGEIDGLCAQAGFEKVGEAGGMVLYQRFSEPD